MGIHNKHPLTLDTGTRHVVGQDIKAPKIYTVQLAFEDYEQVRHDALVEPVMKELYMDRETGAQPTDENGERTGLIAGDKRRYGSSCSYDIHAGVLHLLKRRREALELDAALTDYLDLGKDYGALVYFSSIKSDLYLHPLRTVLDLLDYITRVAPKLRYALGLVNKVLFAERSKVVILTEFPYPV